MNNSNNKQPILVAEHLAKHFNATENTVKVLDDVNLSLYAGQTMSIMGASGSGKSTLMHLLGGLELPTSGSVNLMGKDLAKLSTVAKGSWRNKHLGFVYQFHHLLPELSALENVALPLRIRRVDQKQAQQQAAHYLEQVGLANRASHRPCALSGGERQRVAIARALVTQPSCVLADEPTGNLDQQTANTVYQLMVELAHKQKTGFILVTHDPQLASQCDVRCELKSGILSLADGHSSSKRIEDRS